MLFLLTVKGIIMKILRAKMWVGFIAMSFLSLSFYIMWAAPEPNNVPKKTIKKIVIDAGHGGRDPGCHGQYSFEKDITLAVSLRLGEMIKKNMRDVQVLYTREFDWYPSLPQRHKIANDAEADLFISIHVNSSPARVTTATGTETFVLGLHRTDQKEGAIGDYANSVVQEEGVLNPKDPMTQILIAQYSQTFLSSSILLGTFVEEQFAGQGRRSGGVKQKGLEVLAGSAMPAVLIELGFLNNPGEEAYLNSPTGKEECAQAIFNAIKSYKLELEKGAVSQSPN